MRSHLTPKFSTRCILLYIGKASPFTQTRTYMRNRQVIEHNLIAENNTLLTAPAPGAITLLSSPKEMVQHTYLDIDSFQIIYR